jgi:Zn-dependent protease with chaperone function
MVWHREGWLSYSLAIGFLSWAGLSGLWLTWQGNRSLRQIYRYPKTELHGHPLRVVELPLLYSAQVGFWQPELIVSQSLLTTMEPAHLQAILLHEQAHHYYRDTFWFFWFGWVRRLTAWLPHTEALWQELLLLREIRADRQAAQQTDALLLAEALLIMVSSKPQNPEDFAQASLLVTQADVAFSQPTPPSRLMQRIEALFAEPETSPQPIVPLASWSSLWLLLALLPLVVVPFHS